MQIKWALEVENITDYSYSEYVETDNDLRRCAYKLYSSSLFAQHADYVRTQLVHCLLQVIWFRLRNTDNKSWYFLQDDEADILYITATLLLADARNNESTFELLNVEGAFQRMVDLIKAPTQEGEEGLHRLLMELLYEMSRIQKVTSDNLGTWSSLYVSCKPLTASL